MTENEKQVRLVDSCMQDLSKQLLKTNKDIKAQKIRCILKSLSVYRNLINRSAS